MFLCSKQSVLKLICFRTFEFRSSLGTSVLLCWLFHHPFVIVLVFFLDHFMSILSILVIKADLKHKKILLLRCIHHKWCIQLSRSLFLYFNLLNYFVLQWITNEGTRNEHMIRIINSNPDVKHGIYLNKSIFFICNSWLWVAESRQSSCMTRLLVIKYKCVSKVL